MSNNQNQNLNTLRNAINNDDKHENIYQARKELELDIYNEHTIDANLTINFPRINIVEVIDEIVNKHDYVLIEINRMSIKELQEIIKTRPHYMVERIHSSYVIEAAIFDALATTTKSNIFYNFEYMLAHIDEKFAKSMHK